MFAHWLRERWLDLDSNYDFVHIETYVIKNKIPTLFFLNIERMSTWLVMQRHLLNRRIENISLWSKYNYATTSFFPFSIVEEWRTSKDHFVHWESLTRSWKCGGVTLFDILFLVLGNVYKSYFLGALVEIPCWSVPFLINKVKLLFFKALKVIYKMLLSLIPFSYKL